MTPQIATLLVALIALMIGVAFKFRINPRYTQIETPCFRGKSLVLLTHTWKAALTAAAAIALMTFGIGHGHSLIALVTGSGLLFGAVTQNFLWPATGAASPTAAQVANQDSVTADIVTDGVATTFTVTHNLGISAADITAGYPIVIFEPNSPTGIPATLLILITRPIASGNAVVLTFAAVAATFRIRILRPHSIGR
jgi:hypothetical protein